MKRPIGRTSATGLAFTTTYSTSSWDFWIVSGASCRRCSQSRRKPRLRTSPSSSDRWRATSSGSTSGTGASGTQGLRLDRKRRLVRHEGQEAALTGREFQLLGFLLEHPHRFFSVDKIRG